MEFTKGFTKSDTKIMKGIAICLMLWFHLFACPERAAGDMFVSLLSFENINLAEYLGSFGEISAALLALLFGYECYERSKEAPDINALVKCSLSELFRTFWTVFLVCFPVLAYIRRAMRSLLIHETVYNFLGLSTTFNEDWWFVLPFAVMLILFPIIKRFLNRARSSLYIDLLVLVVLNTIIVYVIPVIITFPAFETLAESIFWTITQRVLNILPAYIIGCVFARYDILSEIKEKLGNSILWRIAAVLGICAVFLVHFCNYKYYDFVNAGLFIVFTAVLLPTKPMILLGKVFEKLGEESTYMWLVHSFFCYYWMPKLTYMPKYSPLIFLWLLLLSFVSAKIIRLIRKYFGVLCDKLAQRNGAAA